MLFKKSQRTSARKYWLRLHLYLGLFLGAFFVLTGLTGSALAFYIEVDEWLHPQLVLTQAQQSQTHQSYETLFQAIKAAHPGRDKAWRLELPDELSRMLTARYYQPTEKAGLAFAPLQVWVNPVTAEVVSSRFWGEYVMTWIYDLHYTLLLDMSGRTLLSVIGLFILTSLLTGLYLWWPTRKKMKTALTYKSNASVVRKNYDIHKLTGVYGGVMLLLIVGTGVLLGYPDTQSAVSIISPLYQPESTASIHRQDSQRLTLDEAVVIASSLFPDAKVKWIETPSGAIGSYRINLRQVGEPSQRFPKTNVWIDQYSGKVLSIRNIHDDSAGDTFLRWLHPLHSGEAFGLPGRIVVFLCGFLPLILFITGVIRWHQKRKVKFARS